MWGILIIRNWSCTLVYEQLLISACALTTPQLHPDTHLYELVVAVEPTILLKYC